MTPEQKDFLFVLALAFVFGASISFSILAGKL